MPTEAFSNYFWVKLFILKRNELFNYAKKMRVRGDEYNDILRFLERNTHDKLQIEEILKSIQVLEKKGVVEVPRQKTSRNLFGIFIGIALIAFGSFLMKSLWNDGYIAIIPFILVGLGIMALFNKIN